MTKKSKQVASFRETVPQVLASVLGCTHLNDVLRGLADVPALARRLPPSGDNTVDGCR